MPFFANEHLHRIVGSLDANRFRGGFRRASRLVAACERKERETEKRTRAHSIPAHRITTALVLGDVFAAIVSYVIAAAVIYGGIGFALGLVVMQLVVRVRLF